MPQVNIAGYPNNLVAFQVTIPSGAAASEMFSTQGMSLVSIQMPGSWTTANIGYASTWDGSAGSLQSCFDSAGNAEHTIVAAAQNTNIPMADATFGPFLQLLSVSASDNVTPVNQGAARVITLLLRKYLD